MSVARLIVAAFVAMLASSSPQAESALASRGKFRNPLSKGADPWVVQHEGYYYWCITGQGSGIGVYRSKRLTELGTRHVVWTPPENGPTSRQLWAPEIHFLDGKAYIYFAASDGDNASHRMFVLESTTTNPLGPYLMKGELYTGDDVRGRTRNRWAIDGTVLTLGGKRFFVWSGWENERDIQWLYIAEMSNPWTVSSNRVRLCANDDFLWERVNEKVESRGLNEGPQVLQHDGRTFVVFSASASWRASYKLGLLELRKGADPLVSGSWSKHPEPVFTSTAKTFGVGHGAFTRSPDGTEWWQAFHAKVERADGWARVIHVQPFTWTATGRPDFGHPIEAGVELLLPSGEANLHRN